MQTKSAPAAVARSSHFARAPCKPAEPPPHSTGSSCCSAPDFMLASNRMLNLLNFDVQPPCNRPVRANGQTGHPALLGLAADHAAKHPHIGRPPRSSSSSARRTTLSMAQPNRSDIMSTSLAKLGFHSTFTKQTTSHSLIDNLNGFIMKPFTLSGVDGSRLLRLIPVAAKAGRLRFASVLAPACSQLSTVDSHLISNRHIPELESPVSHRKQRIGPLSNRHKFAFCNFSSLFIPASLPPCLSVSSPILIANDMHSRKSSSACKKSTYEILIANEMHCCSTPQSASSTASSGTLPKLLSPSQALR